MIRWLRRILIALAALLLGICVLASACALLPPATAPVEAKPGGTAIARIERVEIGGVEQTVLLRGRNERAPVFLYLHGGPGFATLPLSKLYADRLEEHFVVVHWDQRGAGASCRGVDPETLTLERAVADAIELSEWLTERPGTGGRIVLLGHSWGSVVGALAVQRRPDLFHAYVGLGQLVNGLRNEEVSYRWTVEEARRRGDERALAELATVSPPYETTDDLTVQRSWLNAYDGSFYDRSAFDRMWPPLVFGREWALGTRLRWYGCMMRSLDRMWGELEDVDFPTSIPRLEVPVFFFTGRHDWNTPFELVEEWAGVLEAPHVEIVWFDDAGHMIPLESPAAFQREVVERVLPRVERGVAGPASPAD